MHGCSYHSVCTLCIDSQLQEVELVNRVFWDNQHVNFKDKRALLISPLKEPLYIYEIGNHMELGACPIAYK